MMNKSISQFSICVLFMITVSCCSIDDNKTDAEEFNFAQFDYLEQLYFLKTWKECQQLIPEPKTLAVDNEDGFGYNLGQNDIKQNATFLFYGAEFFTEAVVEIDFNQNPEMRDTSFTYITELIEKQRGKATLHDVLSNQETITWFEETMNGELYVVTLTKYDQLIVLQLRSEEIEYGGGDEGGEWVQRGEDGEWIFVPD